MVKKDEECNAAKFYFEEVKQRIKKGWKKCADKMFNLFDEN